MRRQSPKILFIYPRFDLPSFWNYFEMCRAMGTRSPAPPLGLMTVAAMLPADWELRLSDRNVRDLDDAEIGWADLVMTGGMMSQRQDVLRLIDRCHGLGRPVAVGGPDVTSSPSAFEAADFRVLGEAEEVIGELVDAWRNGDAAGTFEAEKFTIDVTASPQPRYDLVDMNDYLMMNIQFSRGCPFNCEFCDIIELYGRVPRTKTSAQICAELDALYDGGFRGTVLFVDDNLIGNKKALKLFLPDLIAWQRERGYPFDFSTQASVNLADDEELLEMLRAARFEVVFIGIESPNANTLVSAQKKQNAQRDLARSIHRIYEAGMIVMAGFIVGFDDEAEGVADEMVAYIDQADIPICMVGLLTALPGTQLWRRLDAEGRLDPVAADQIFSGGDHGDQCTGGINFELLRPRDEVLGDYRSILARIYTPRAYFRRIDAVARRLRLPIRQPDAPVRGTVDEFVTLVRVLWFVGTRHPRLFPYFVGGIVRCIRHNGAALKATVTMMLFYLHLGPFAQYVIGELDQDLDRGHRTQSRRNDPTVATA